MDFYDVYGFSIAVEGSAKKKFSQKYGHFRVSVPPERIHLYVRVCRGQEDLPTRPAGSSKGMRIPFRDDENILWYQEGIPLHFLLSHCEGLMRWPDKISLHAGGVAKDGNAFIFSGGPKAGKTSAVLNLLKQDYEYLGDDWVVIDEGKAYPLGRLVHIDDYSLRDSELARSVLGVKRFLYEPLFWILGTGAQYFPQRHFRFALGFLKHICTLYVDLKKVNPKAKVGDATAISKVFYFERADIQEMRLSDDISAQELARRMAYVYLYEWSFMFREYYRYAYLYGVRNKEFEERYDHNARIARDAFEKVELRKVMIPRNMDLRTADLVSKLGLA